MTDKEKVILGIDPGTNLLGFGIVRVDAKGRPNFVDMGVLDLRKEKDSYVKLRRIYEKITNRTSTGVIDDSIDKLTDPLNNSINEKCSRIREAFVKLIDKSLAEYYYISGTKSQAKQITLPRNLVEWQCEI